MAHDPLTPGAPPYIYIYNLDTFHGKNEQKLKKNHHINCYN